LSETTSDAIKIDLETNPHGLGENHFHFYRCDSCTSLVTYDAEERARLTGAICACGSRRYSPTNPLDHEWGLPHIKAYCEKNDIQPCYEAQL
jgi:hypothetical protein